jgi:hypothetical protein
VSYLTQFLQYVANTNGGATKADFVEDWEPIGERVWDELWGAELIELDADRKVHLTKSGQAELMAVPDHTQKEKP